MRIVLILMSVLFAGTVNAQIGHEDFYSAKQLELKLKLAKTVVEQIDAFGCLAVHYKSLRNDTLKKFYLSQVYSIAQNTKDVKATGRALWWGLYFESSVYDDWDYEACEKKAGELFQYAEQHNLMKERISGNLIMSDVKVHQDITAAERYVLTAKSLLDHWKQDTAEKDSLRLLLYNNLAHVYIHKKDGIQAATFMQFIKDYTLGEKDEPLKIMAYEALAQMYFEWGGQAKRAIPWYEKEYEYFKRTGQPNRLLE